MMFDNISVLQAKDIAATSSVHNWFIFGSIILIVIIVLSCYCMKKQEQMTQDQDEQNDRSRAYRAKEMPAYGNSEVVQLDGSEENAS